MKCMTSGSLSRSNRLSTSASVNRRSSNRSVSRKTCISRSLPLRDHRPIRPRTAGAVGTTVNRETLVGRTDELFERPHLHPIPPPGEISGVRVLRREIEDTGEAKVVQPCAQVVGVEERHPWLAQI